MSPLCLLALTILCLHIVTLADIVLGLRRMQWLGDVTFDLPPAVPLVSIIIPACNEETTLAGAIATLQEQTYPNIELIVVNDRSTDNTAGVLTQLQEISPRPITVLTIDQLPPGWLGKSHALQVGADHATGEILLFTDADIHMETTTISRAVCHLTDNHLDHLCLLFQQVGGSWLLNGMILDAAGGLLALFKPWKAGDKKSRHFMGVGAFNMVRATTYQAIGGHRLIPMHPVDDIMLGKIIKEHGFRQQCLLGQPFVTVCWYSTAREMVAGLMKNVFSVVHYRGWLAILSMVLIFILTILPMISLLLATGPTRLLFTAAIFLRLAGLVVGARRSAMPPIAVIGGLLAPVISIYIIGRSAWNTRINHGISWRGTHYSLDALRKSRPLLF